MPKKRAATKRPTRAKRAVPPEAAAPDVLDLKEAAAFLKVSKPTFYRWLAQGATGPILELPMAITPGGPQLE